MEELRNRLNKVEDSYFDFVSAMIRYAEKKPERLNKLLNFIESNPDAKSSEIIRFVSDQDDFYEDAAYI